MEPWRDVDAHNGGVEVQNGAVQSVVADSHHFDEEQDPDPDPLPSEKSDPDPHQSKRSDLDCRQSAQTDPTRHQRAADPYTDCNSFRIELSIAEHRCLTTVR